MAITGAYSWLGAGYKYSSAMLSCTLQMCSSVLLFIYLFFYVYPQNKNELKSRKQTLMIQRAAGMAG